MREVSSSEKVTEFIRKARYLVAEEFRGYNRMNNDVTLELWLNNE